MLWAFRSSSPCLWKCYGALWAEEQLSGVNWQSACAPVHNHLSLAWDPLTRLKKMSDTFAKEPHDVSSRQGKARDCNSSFKRQGPVILQRKTIRSEVLFVPPVRRWREVVKQMAIWAKYSQKWIKLYNIFTPTARHNDRLYLVSTTEYRTLEQQKYLTSHLWWLSSWAKLNVLSLLDQKPLRINGWVNSAFVFWFLVFFFFSCTFFFQSQQLSASLSLSPLVCPPPPVFSLTLLSAGLSSGFHRLANVLDMDYPARPHQKNLHLGWLWEQFIVTHINISC